MIPWTRNDTRFQRQRDRGMKDSFPFLLMKLGPTNTKRLSDSILY
jgi:hypothetical protein